MVKLISLPFFHYGIWEPKTHIVLLIVVKEGAGCSEFVFLH